MEQFLDTILPPEDISQHGHLVDWLFNYITAFNVFYFFLLCLGLFGFTFWYHHKRHPKAYYTYGQKKKHILMTTALGIIVFLTIDLNVLRIGNNDYLNVFNKWPSEDEDIVRIEVLAQQWAWNFRYAGDDGQFNTEDDIVTLNHLRLPIKKDIVFQLISKDVIHSFFVPNTRRKVDVFPGRISRLWYHLKKTGEYPIACAEMCGTYHYRMQAKMTVYTQEDFNDWLAEASEKAKYKNEFATPEMYWGWKWNVAQK